MLPGKKYTPDEYARIAWRRRWYIAIPAVVIASVTIVVSMFLPNRYRASSSILIIPQRVPENFVRPTVTADLGERLNMISQQILSRTRLERIVQEFNLYERERQRGAIMEDVIDRMRKDISVNIARPRSRRDDINSFSVAFDANDGRTAMRVTERLASLFVQENLEDRELLADQTDQFLKGQLEEARRRLAEQERKLQEFRQRNNGRLPDQVESNLTLLQGAQTRLQNIAESANRDRDRLMALEKTLSEMPPTSVAAPTQQPRRGGGEQNAPMTAAQALESARGELRLLELRLKPEHPDIGRAKRVIAELEAKAETEALQQPLSAVTPAPNFVVDRAAQLRAEQLRAETQEIRQRLESEKREAARLQESIADLTSRVQAGPGLQSQMSELTRDYSTTQDGYMALLRKSDESKMAVNLERRQIGEQFKTIDGARLPEKPISPNRVRINMFGILGGLAVGLGLVAFLEYRDTSFKSDEDVMTTLSLPVLAVIPIMTNAGERRSARRRKLMLAASASVVCMLLAAAVMVVWRLRLVDAWLR
jgi:polysaccharide chain length determinant protein (PEP-CTERM system associated)